MKFGVFDHLDRGNLPLKDYYEARLKVIEALTERASTPIMLPNITRRRRGLAPSPSVFLVAWRSDRRLTLRHRWFMRCRCTIQFTHHRGNLYARSDQRRAAGDRLRSWRLIHRNFFLRLDPAKAQQIYTEGLELVIQGLSRECSIFVAIFFVVRKRSDGTGTTAETLSADLVWRPLR